MAGDTGKVPLLVAHLIWRSQIVVADEGPHRAGVLWPETVGGRQNVPVGDEGAAAEPVSESGVCPPPEQHHPRPAALPSTYRVEFQPRPPGGAMDLSVRVTTAFRWRYCCWHGR